MNRLRLFLVVVAFFALPVLSASAMNPADQPDSAAVAAASKEYSDRYDMLVSRLGAAGVGIETLLDNWSKVDPDNKKLLVARYTYYITKAGTTVVVDKPGKKYLGNAPVLTLKDSLGNDVRYFEEIAYDDSLYTLSLKPLDRAIKVYSNDLDVHFMKAAALLSYEKESPDMALNYLQGLIDDYYSGGEWVYDGTPVDDEFFEAAIQEYCFSLYNIASPASYSAFKSLSEKMLQYRPEQTMFISNVGSYYLVCEDNPKKALKYYNQVLKISPEDYTAAKNCVLLSRRQKNVKLEKKYLPLLIASTPNETERLAAEARLKGLDK